MFANIRLLFVTTKLFTIFLQTRLYIFGCLRTHGVINYNLQPNLQIFLQICVKRHICLPIDLFLYREGKFSASGRKKFSLPTQIWKWVGGRQNARQSDRSHKL